MTGAAARVAPERPVSARLAAAFPKAVRPAEGKRMYLDTDEGSTFDEYLAEADRPREGYWSPFTTLAWIAARDPKLVAATQHYESAHHANHGSAHTAPAWMVISDRLEHHCGRSLDAALPDLLEALQADRVPGVVAREGRADAPRDVARREWQGGFKRAFQHWGLELLPGLHHFGFPSEAVRSAFPCAGDCSAELPAAPATELETAIPDRPARGRRVGTGGFAESDAALADEMKLLIANGDAVSPWDAARIVAPKAKGAETNKQKRLTEVYYRLHPRAD